MNNSWKFIWSLLIALVASNSAWSAEPENLYGENFTLEIFGNANMDNTIDEMDVAYVEGVIKGTNAATNLSDANYDGAIDEKDLTQIELIIRGEDTELTFKDLYGDVVTVHKPIKRIVSGHSTLFQVLRALGAENEIVGIDKYTIEMGKVFLQDSADLPSVGGNSLDSKDYEAILALHPDVFLDNAWYPTLAKEVQEKVPGVPVIGLMCTNMPLSNATESIIKLGYIIDRRDEAKEFTKWYNGYISKITERTSKLSEDDLQKVYIECYTPFECFCQFDNLLDLAGGKNVGADQCNKGYEGYGFTVDPEWVIEQNPDVIIYINTNISGSYDKDDLQKAIDTRKEIFKRTGFNNITAVKEGRVYLMDRYGVAIFPTYVLGTAYMAKWFHPDLFEELDPQAIHQEYLTRFQHLDYDLDEHGVFVYPPLNES